MDYNEKHEYDGPPTPLVYSPNPKGIDAVHNLKAKWKVCELEIYDVDAFIKWLQSTNKKKIKLDVKDYKGSYYIKENDWTPDKSKANK